MYEVNVVDTKEVIGSRIEGQKDNGQKKIGKGTNNDPHTLHRKLKIEQHESH